MKINPNIIPNIGQQDIEKTPAGPTPAFNPALQGDRLEVFHNRFGFLQTADLVHQGPHANDAVFGAGLLFGAHPVSFGIAFTPDLQASPAPAAPPADDSFSIRDIQPFGLIGDAFDWLGENFPKTPELFKFLGEKTVDGFLAAGEAIGDGLKAVKDGFDAVGRGVGNAMASIENAISDAFDW